MVQAVVALGGNVGDVGQTFDRAMTLALENSGVNSVRSANRYRSVAMGVDAGDSFVNSALVVDTTLEPLAFLDLLQQIESTLGRTREVRWGPRTLDLDLIFFGDQVIDLPRLVVPHPHCWYRQFVLTPVASLVPEFVHPVFGLSTKLLLERLLVDSVSFGYAGTLVDEQRVSALVAEYSHVEFRRIAPHSSSVVPVETLAFWFGSPESKPQSPFWLQVSDDDELQFVRDVLTAATVSVELA